MVAHAARRWATGPRSSVRTWSSSLYPSRSTRLLERDVSLDPGPRRAVRRAARALKPGGKLVAQCGGRGNIDAFRTLADEVARRSRSRRTSRTGSGRGTTPATRPQRGSTAPGSRMCVLARAGVGRRRRIRARSSRRCVSSATSTRCPSELRERSSIACWSARGAGRARLRAPEHAARRGSMTARGGGGQVVLLPGDGIGPEINAIGARVLHAVAPPVSSTSRSTLSAAPRSTRTGPRSPKKPSPRPAAAPTPCCLRPWAGPKWDTTDPDRATARTGPARGAPRTESVREPAPGPAGAGALRRKPAANGEP